MTDLDARDKHKARTAGLALLVLVVLVLGGVALLFPALDTFVASSLTPGMDLQTAALTAFGVTVVLFVLFAVVAGDGLIGELQFMLAGFFSFFLILTLLLAWIF